MGVDEEVTPSNNLAPREVNYPAFTWDYRLVNNGKCGLGLVANRNIKKGARVFSDSYEFLFADVQDGDVLRFDQCDKAARRQQKYGGHEIPATFPLSRDVLTRTHGVPCLYKKPSSEDKSARMISWHLEVPGMLINHSCDPNIIDDSHDNVKGEAYAARDIKKGEELSYDYTFQYYDHGPFFEQCFCGSENCRGKMMGFKALTDEQKKQVLPFASEAVKAMHEEDMCTCLPLEKKQKSFPPRATPKDAEAAVRLVVSGPSHAHAPVSVKLSEETGRYGLYATESFQPGERVYEFWTQCWPSQGTVPIEMIFSSHLLEGDPQEGTMIRVNAHECAKRDYKGRLQFSGWDLFTAHSCEPNLVYNDKNEDEDDDWRGAYAARPIYKGDLLIVDFNTLLWDRTTAGTPDLHGLGNGVCKCGAKNCRGTVKGFKFLSTEEQNELKNLPWTRSVTKTSKGRFIPGEALSRHVRKCCRARAFSPAPPDILSTSSSSSSSSDDSESSSSEEEDELH